MASSKVVMPSTSPSNPDLPRHSPSSSSLHRQYHYNYNPPFSTTHHHHPHNQQQQSSNDRSGSMNMDEILRNICSESEAFPPFSDNGGGEDAKRTDNMWRDMVNGGGGGGNREPAMTLEDFLTKAGAVAEEDVGVAAVAQPAAGGYGVETMMNSAEYQPGMQIQSGPPGGYGVEAEPLGFGNGMVTTVGGGASGSGSGRGKRRAVEGVPLDKATQQRQKRMIKNRESAARSRERKQAYMVELESLVTQLEEENARLLKEEAELNKQRYKQLMENLIPVMEKHRPQRVLRRVRSMGW